MNLFFRGCFEHGDGGGGGGNRGTLCLGGVPLRGFYSIWAIKKGYHMGVDRKPISNVPAFTQV